MTLVKIPLPLRVAAYLLGLLVTGLGTPIVGALAQDGTISGRNVIVAWILIGFVGVLSSTFALSHLTLPDAGAPALPSTAPSPAVDEPTGAPATTSTSAGGITSTRAVG